MSHRMHMDQTMKLIGKLLFGIKKGPEVLNTVRPAGQPLVDDWDCLKTMVVLLLFIFSLMLLKLFWFHLVLHIKQIFTNNICGCAWWVCVCRWGVLRHIVDPYLNTGWNTCGPWQTSATPEWQRSRWPRLQHKPARAFLLAVGAPCTGGSAHDFKKKKKCGIWITNPWSSLYAKHILGCISIIVNVILIASV